MFKLFRIFCISFSLFFAALFSESYAQKDNIYTVENVATAAAAKSAGDAKIIATNNARRDAFATLLSRLSLSSKIADGVSNDQIFDMVRSEHIAEEKIAGNSYSAVLNISFFKNAVDQVLKNKSIDVTVNEEDPYLLIPVKVIKAKGGSDKFILWEEDNDWKSVIEKSLTAKSLKKFILPENDISNVSIINQNNVDRLNYSQLEPLFVRYKAAGAYVVFLYPDNIENKVSIVVKKIKKLQKKQVKLNFVNINRLSKDELLSKVADKTIEYLIASQSDNSAKIDNIVKLEIRVHSLANWMMLKNKIESSNLISQMNIEAVSKDYVRVAVDYVGSNPDIVAAFVDLGFNLSKKADNFYTVSFQSPASLAIPTFKSSGQ